MKKLIFKILFLTLVIFVPVSVMAEVSVQVNIPLPPPIIFPAPPHVVVLPETYVYAVPDMHEDIFFYSGWWWRPWEGRWYRSRHYDRGWSYYNRVPSFYSGLPPGWRDDYRDHRWRGRQWDYRRIPYQDLNRNWNSWQKDRHWEKQNTWGVQGLPPKQHPPREVKHQPPPAQHHEAQPPREVRSQPRPVQSREIKAQGRHEISGAEAMKDRRQSGEVKRPGKHERETQEKQERK